MPLFARAPCSRDVLLALVAVRGHRVVDELDQQCRGLNDSFQRRVGYGEAHPTKCPNDPLADQTFGWFCIARQPADTVFMKIRGQRSVRLTMPFAVMALTAALFACSDDTLPVSQRDTSSDLNSQSDSDDTQHSTVASPVLMLVLGDSIDAEDLSNYVTIKSADYSVVMVTTSEISDWCDDDDSCDRSLVPIWSGSIPLDEDAPGDFTRSDLTEFCGECRAEWPSILRSYLATQRRELYGERFEAVLLVGDPAEFPYVVIWDQLPTMLYYTDLAEPLSDELHTWVADQDGVLLDLFDDNDDRCGPRDEECDYAWLAPYEPEISLGLMPFSDSELAGRLLVDSANTETERADDLARGLFLAVSTFVEHDTWFPTDRAARIWDDRRTREALTLYGEAGSLDISLPGYPRPDCTLPDERFSCWMDGSASSGFGFTLMNSHGLPRLVQGILDPSLVGSNTLPSRRTNVYTSIACSNLMLTVGLESRRSSVALIPVEDDRPRVLWTRHVTHTWFEDREHWLHEISEEGVLSEPSMVGLGDGTPSVWQDSNGKIRFFVTGNWELNYLADRGVRFRPNSAPEGWRRGRTSTCFPPV